ncbi:MAG TPA: hypothetical protein ENK16_00715, partial [Chromatiales bacterium]|nr:hypothetical protein [Chromatiales bacterium]
MNRIATGRPDIIRLLASPAGQLLIWLIAIPLLWRNGVPAIVLVALTLTMLLPKHRRAILSVASGALLLRYFAQAGFADTSSVLPAVILIMACFGLYRLAILLDQPAPALTRHPWMLLHALIWSCLILLFFMPKSPTLLAGVALISSMTWAAAYLFAAGRRGQLKGTGFHDHFFYLMPFHTLGFPINLGKGHDYLSRHEAQNPEQLARSQLAGLKLLFLAVVWSFSVDLIEAIAYRPDDNWYTTLLPAFGPQIPHLGDLIRHRAGFSLPVAWASLILEFIDMILQLAIWGHVAIALLRLTGFNVFRHTYRPLLAESIVDFWGRMGFYFKEICVDFFFYPVFLRCTWARPELRLFLAIFAAAFVGNLYWHLLKNSVWLVTWDIQAFSDFFIPRMIYMAALTTGIWIS